MSPRASIFLVLATAHFLFQSSWCIEFVYNSNFSSTNLFLVGSATVDSPPSILTLTNDTIFSIGRGLYPSKISAAAVPLPFATSFIFSMAPYKNILPGHGFAFVFLPSAGIAAADPAQHLGIFNFTNNGDPRNRIFGVEFDVFANQEFDDIDANHVGLDVNSLSSVSSATAGFWGGKSGEKFTELKLNSGVLLDNMFVGFTGATGQLVQSHRILAWSFSNSDFSIGDALTTTNLPSFVLSKNSVIRSKGFIAGVSISSLVFIGVIGLALYAILVKRQRKWREEDVEDWETEYWPHRVHYRDVFAATKGFSEENLIGFGGNTKVYRGVLDGRNVAVKRITISPRESVSGTREFLAEVSSLGRLRHKNLVGLKGWCRKGGESLMLVYEYMEKGSVDKRIFGCEESLMLSWEERMSVIRDVASGIFYLHEGWEAKVLHRDIKASNVLLDKDMSARVGDFGLAKMNNTRQELLSTTRIVGTAGYMAPELVRTGRASTQTDVYSFGVFVLEIVCGRRPIEEGKPGLVEYVWELMGNDRVADARDERLKAKRGYAKDEVERILRIGMLCAHPDPRVRPTMRQVVQIMGDGDGEGIDREGTEVSLLERVRSSQMLGRGEGTHPTFQDVWNSVSGSISLWSSDSLLEGR
ncbi:PREDICTED: probable L-type lectin-domain containing receptor kinase VII.2 isoform X2 [Tarenaya hassleriana]|uniref:probable L-type lectin-domain containing receptor kinase VII.2 isoform X2 n=1 Tax=Tarenaya hassleriana TaxID=28532 RepID=UPI00053C0B33|nr:PREDICTED: probable L-type lectin-domain containing receptor kinase VII.2 isoform X2 [Tarenaya hassleriana]